MPFCLRVFPVEPLLNKLRFLQDGMVNFADLERFLTSPNEDGELRGSSFVRKQNDAGGAP